MKAWLYIVTTGFAFGVGGLVTKYLVDDGLDPVLGTALMMGATVALTIPLHVRAGKLPAHGWRMAMLAGALNGGTGAVLINLGFEQLPASINTLVFALGPVFAALAAHYLGQNDRFSLTKAMGLGAAVVGVGFLAGSLRSASPAALAFPLVAAAVTGGSLVLVKRVSALYPPALTLTPLMAGAALFSLVLTAALGRFEGVAADHWPLIIFNGLTGIAGFGAILAATEIASASQTSLSGYLIPLIGVLGGVLLFDEPFGWRVFLGAVLVLSGILLATRTHPRAAIVVEQRLQPSEKEST